VEQILKLYDLICASFFSYSQNAINLSKPKLYHSNLYAYMRICADIHKYEELLLFFYLKLNPNSFTHVSEQALVFCYGNLVLFPSSAIDFCDHGNL